MRRWLEQLRLLIADNVAIFVAGLFLLSVLGGFVTYTTHVDPGTEIEQQEMSNWRSTAAYTHEATVQTQTPVFTVGETLTDQSVYLQSIAPILNGTFQYSYDASASGSLTANATLTLVLRSVGENTEFWRDEQTLATTRTQQLGPSEEFAVPFSVNVTDQQRRINEIEEELGGTPGESEVSVQTTLRLTGQRNGQPVNETITHGLAIQTGGGTYSVATDSAVTNSGRQSEPVRVAASYGPLRSAGGPLVVVLSVLGLAGVVGSWASGLATVSESEREWIDFQSERQTFDEWLTQGTVPSDAMDGRTVEVDSLEGLVDVAIDSNRRVIEDPSRDIFAVLLDETTYQYEPPTPPADGDSVLATPGTTAGSTGEDVVAESDGGEETEES